MSWPTTGKQRKVAPLKLDTWEQVKSTAKDVLKVKPRVRMLETPRVLSSGTFTDIESQDHRSVGRGEHWLLRVKQGGSQRGCPLRARMVRPHVWRRALWNRTPGPWNGTVCPSPHSVVLPQPRRATLASDQLAMNIQPQLEHGTTSTAESAYDLWHPDAYT